MNYRVLIEAEAEREFAEAIAFYEEREAGLGQRFAHDFYDAFQKVCEDPERFPLASRLTRKVKIPPPWPYSIYFAIKSKTQEVVNSTVWHGARNPAELRRRLP